MVSTGHELQATSRRLNPTPALPGGEGALFGTSYEPPAFRQLQTVIHKPQATNHMPPFPDSPGEAGPTSCDPGSMRRVAPSPGLQSIANYGPQATGHRPSSRHLTTHHVLRTTNPRGGHAGPPLRHRKQRAATTGHEPQATCRFFVIPAKRVPRLARAGPDQRSLRRSWRLQETVVTKRQQQ